MKRPPTWLLYALIPIVLAGGFVGGVAYKTYQKKPAAEPPAPAVAETSQQAPSPAAPQGPVPTPPAKSSPSAGAAPVRTSPAYGTVAPATGFFVDPPVGGNLATALSILQSDFTSLTVGDQTLTLSGYHVLPGTVMNKNTISGWISAAQYPAWERAVRFWPDDVRAWMNKAAAAVKPYAADFAFELSWSVVDVVTTRPQGFDSYEVSSKGDGRYLVVRPLAATAFLYSKYDKVGVYLRPFNAYGSRTNVGPWSTYSPSLDMLAALVYVPPGTADAGTIAWKYRPPSTTSPGQLKTVASTLNEAGRAVIINGNRLTVREYQPLPLASETVLGGMISLADYPAWQSALDTRSEDVRTWVADMVERVRPTPNQLPFRLLWTVVDVVKTPPPGFAQNEMTQVPGGWLITRPLIIAAANPNQTVLAANLRSPGANAVNLPDSAWSTYRAAIYFDAKNQYVIPAK